MITWRTAAVSGRFRVEIAAPADANPGRPFQNGRQHYFVDDVEVSEQDFYRAVARECRSAAISSPDSK
jgi:hypothetical protein